MTLFYIMPNSEIVAISVAKTDCYEADQPEELLNADKEMEWNIEGYRVDTEYFYFDVPLLTKNYKNWLIENYKVGSAFTVNGRGKQQYMCDLNKEHAVFFLNEAIRLQRDERTRECLKKALENL